MLRRSYLRLRNGPASTAGLYFTKGWRCWFKRLTIGVLTARLVLSTTFRFSRACRPGLRPRLCEFDGNLVDTDYQGGDSNGSSSGRGVVTRVLTNVVRS
jgi:hypothetical protein